jgi:hypothetical protein
MFKNRFLWKRSINWKWGKVARKMLKCSAYLKKNSSLLVMMVKIIRSAEQVSGTVEQEERI